MSILDAVPDVSPLSYGDVLKGISLYATAAGNWDKPEIIECRACLVLSRPCVLAHKTIIVVSAVQAYGQPAPREAKDFEEIRDFLEGLRDGADAPDSFYLGQIPQLPPGRYVAKLDSLHSLRIDPRQVPALLQHRIARLNGDFARDLQVRLFTSYANMGFDDHAWLPDGDLAWLLAAGGRKRSDLVANLAGVKAEGFPAKIEPIEKQLHELEKVLLPFQQESDRRANRAKPPQAH